MQHTPPVKTCQASPGSVSPAASLGIELAGFRYRAEIYRGTNGYRSLECGGVDIMDLITSIMIIAGVTASSAARLLVLEEASAIENGLGG